MIEPGFAALKIAFIGAGPANFGGSDGLVPGESLGGWNHAIRLEQLQGVTVVAIVDPHTELAQYHLRKHQGGAHAEKWQQAQLFPSHHAMLESQVRPDAAIIGAPSNVRGSLDDPSCTMELDLAKEGIHMLVEKPISIKPAAEVLRLSEKMQQLQKEKGLVISVGYQMRYLTAVDAVKKLLVQHDAPVAAINGRYHGVYNLIKRAYHCDEAVSGGIIVQQATHFVDLMRYFCGDVIPERVGAASVGPDYPLSESAALAPEGEHQVPQERRSNRATSAVFTFESGTLGTLIHTKVLHGQGYFTEMEIISDGLHIILVDPYNAPAVKVRRKHSDAYEQLDLGPPSDMYMLQMEAFIKAVRGDGAADIRSSYASAAKTYELTRLIQTDADKHRSPGRGWAERQPDAGHKLKGSEKAVKQQSAESLAQPEP